MLSNCVQLGQSVSELFQLVDLIIAQLLSLSVLFLQLGKFLGQVGQSLSGVLDLLKHVRLALLDQIV